MTPYLLLALGLLFVLLEFYLPGAVLGTIGGILIVSSLINFAQSYDSVLANALFLFLTIGLLIAVIKFALWRIPKSKSIYLKTDQEGYIASQYDRNAIGQTAVVFTDLKPGGYILIKGEQHQAISESGYLTKGAEVVVIGGEGESLIVKKLNKENHS